MNFVSLLYNSKYLILFTFVVLRAEYILTDLYFPDELWHTAFMINPSFYIQPDQKIAFNVLTNYQGFGATYWLLGYLTTFLGSEFRLLLRTFSLFAICLAAIYCMRISKNHYEKVLYLIFFLSTPFFWYGGKFITPEFYLLPLVFLAYILMLNKNNTFVSAFLLGFSIGIKASILPAAIPPFLYYITNIQNWNLKEKINLLKILILSILGFVLASPNILWETKTYFENISPISSSTSTVLHMLFNSGRAWDLVNVTGINQLLPLLTIFFATVLFILFLPKKHLLSYLISILFFLLLMRESGTLMWHYYSIIPIVFYYLFILSKSKVDVQKPLYIFFTVGILINMFHLKSFVPIDMKLRANIYNGIDKHRITNTNCIIRKMNNLAADGVIIDTTHLVTTQKNIGLLDINKIRQATNYKFISMFRTPGIAYAEYEKNNELINIYVLIHQDIMKINNFLPRRENYIEAQVIPNIIQNSTFINSEVSLKKNIYKYKKVFNCNTIDIINITKS